jgi:hypothetical protein
MSEPSADPNDTGKKPTKPTRRELIAGIAALVAGAAAVKPLQQAAATSFAPFIVDAFNTASFSSALAATNFNPTAQPAAFDARRAGLGTAVHVEAGPLTDFLTVSTTASYGVSALSDQSGVVAGAGPNRAALRSDLHAIRFHSAGVLGFTNSFGMAGVKAIHTSNFSNPALFSVTHVSSAMHAITDEPDATALMVDHLGEGPAAQFNGPVFINGDLFGTGSGVPSVCRRFLVPTGSTTFTFTDPEIDPDSLLLASFNAQAGRPDAPVYVTYVAPGAGRGRAGFNAPTVRPVQLTVLAFRPCPMSLPE